MAFSTHFVSRSFLSRLFRPNPSVSSKRSRPTLDELEPREVLAAPTAAEQLFLERLNDARANPPAYGASIGLDLNNVAASPPLAFDPRLIDSARGHSQDMNDRNFFSHTGSNGSNPGARMTAAGYPWNGWAESIAAGFTTPESALQGLIVDTGVPDLGHRRHLLAIDAGFKPHQAVGVGIVQNGSGGYHHYYTIDSGYASDRRPYLTGVVYRDTNGNGRYDLTEGVGGATVTVPGVGSVSTWASGGYSLQLSAGTYNVTVSGGGLASSTKSVTVGAANARLNFDGTNRVENDWNGDGVADLFLVRPTNTVSGNIEVDILSGADNFQTLLRHTIAPHPTVGPNSFFEFGDYNRDGTTDLYYVKGSNTGSQRTEVHVLDGASNFQTWTLHVATTLHEIDSLWDLQVVDYNRDGVLDLTAIKKRFTGSNSTEVHVMNGATYFQTWHLHTATALHETGAEAWFRLADVNNDSILDLVYVKKSATGSGKTEFHALSGADGFRTWLAHIATAQGETGAEADFRLNDRNGDGILDLYYVQKSGTASGKVEVHILNGAAYYGQFLSHAITPLATY